MESKPFICSENSEAKFSDEQFERYSCYAHETDSPALNLKRAKLLGLPGENIRVAPGAIVRLHEGSRVGDHCFIGLYCYLNGEIILEDHVIIGPHCSITANSHVFEPEKGAFTGSLKMPIRIGRGTWICAGCSVTSGVQVGKCNLVCANAVVTKDSDDFSILGGVPARKIGEIDPVTGEYHWASKPGV
jgi:acetyltransferase-like isoleucine patch superfamily enzyme